MNLKYGSGNNNLNVDRRTRVARFFSRNSIKEKSIGYLFIAPLLIYFLIFMATPMVIGFFYSFTRWNMRTAPVFVGLKNYIDLITNSVLYPNFWTSCAVTLKFALVSVPLSLIIPLFLAILINKAEKYQGLFKVLFYIPVVTSSVAVAAIWQWILDPLNGLLNKIITSIPFIGDNIGNISWLDNPQTALPIICIMLAWGSTGSNILIYLSGLKGISPDLYEFAEMDGASFKDKVFKITLPLLTPTFFFLIVTTLISSLQMFDIVMVLTSGGPQNSTHTFVYELYMQGVRYDQMGIACAMGYLLFAFIGIITWINFKFIPQNYE